MTLGEKISSLRNGKGMSQGDLAEQMNVSRQSVSKWETNASIPDLDKLIQLSDLFQITIDELVRGEVADDKKTAADEIIAAEIQPQIIIQKNISTQKVVGFILLGFGLLSCLLALFFGFGLLIVGGYIVLCSMLCLLAKKNVALIIGWVTAIIVIAISPFVVGIRIFGVFYPEFYLNGISLIDIMALAFWVLIFWMIFSTIKAVRKRIRK